MFKGRRGLIFAIGLLFLAVVIALLLRQQPGWRAADRELPLDLKRVIPAEWEVLPDLRRECDFDQDGQSEWLIVYRYDKTQIQRPYRQAGVNLEPGPIGAVIYDAQADPSPARSDALGSYRPAVLVPYRLLPDYYAGKGQGYLGESSVEVHLYPGERAGEACATQEISFLGYSGEGLPTRLSVFRWQGRGTGYRVAHFAGNARVDVALSLDGSQPVTAVSTYNRLQNHRSILCEVRSYRRTGRTQDLVFAEDPTAFSLDFCFAAPADPTYPEAVVVAQLRKNAPRSAGGAAALPGKGFFTADAVVPLGVDLGANAPVPILAVTNQAAATIDPEGGRLCTAAQIGSASGQWWCGRELAEVETELALPGGVRRAVWRLISVVPLEVNAGLHWRIERVELR